MTGLSTLRHISPLLVVTWRTAPLSLLDREDALHVCVYHIMFLLLITALIIRVFKSESR